MEEYEFQKEKQVEYWELIAPVKETERIEEGIERLSDSRELVVNFFLWNLFSVELK